MLIILQKVVQKLCIFNKKGKCKTFAQLFICMFQSLSINFAANKPKNKRL